MYEDFFHLHSRPFSPSADTNCYVGIGPIEDARQTISRAIARASGPAVVIGGPGTGKTMLCQVLAEQFQQQLCVVLLCNARLSSPRALLQAILFELGRPYRELDENELRLSLVDFLANSDHCPAGLLLIIDEAHTLSPRLLEEVRLLTNLVRDGQSRVRLVLAGGPALEERLTSPKLESLNQRLAARCYLDRLNRDQTTAYVREQITLAGGQPDSILAEDACKAVFAATDGIPRLVSQVCDHALILATVGRRKTVTAEVIEEAWADLQQLPTPWVEPVVRPGAARPQEVIEFGTLADEEDPQPASIPFPVQAKLADAAAHASVPNIAAQMPAKEFPATVALEFAAGGNSMNAEMEMRAATPQVDVQLDQIERSVIVAGRSFDSEDSSADEFDDLRRPSAVNHPFGESFDEEEVIVDSYATLDETQLAKAPRVASREGREIAALLATRPPAPMPAPVAAAAAQQPPPVVEVAGQRQQQELTAAVAALLDQGVSRQPVHAAHLEATPAAGRTSDTDGDDRDVIVIEEQTAGEQLSPTMPKGRVRRQQYRQLFARLRQG